MYICTHDHYVDVNDMIGGTMEDNLERIPVFVPKAHKEELRRIAYEQRTSVSEEVRKAVAEYLDKMKEEKKMSSLGEALPREIERVQELIKDYESVPMGHIAAGMMKADIKKAHEAMISGDLVGMISAYEELKGYE